MPRSLTLFFSALWFLFLSVGFYQVYLFINGYPLFSFAQKEEQKGYMSFESSPPSLFFMDDEYVGFGKLHALHPLGTYQMCAQKLGYSDRCFSGSMVSPNDQEMLHYTAITLLPEDLTPREVTTEQVFELPKKNGFFWYDRQKKQIFWIDENTESLQSFYPSFVPDEIVWDEKTSSYFLFKTKTRTSPELKTPLSFPSRSFSIPTDLLSYEMLRLTPMSLHHIIPPKTIGSERESRLLAMFSEGIEKEFVFENSESRVLVFAHSALLFSLDDTNFRFLFSKDPQTPVLFFDESRQVWFLHDKRLKVVQL